MADEPSHDIIYLSSDDEENVTQNTIHENNKTQQAPEIESDVNNSNSHHNQLSKRQRLDSLYLNNGPSRPSFYSGNPVRSINSNKFDQPNNPTYMPSEQLIYPNTSPKVTPTLQNGILREVTNDRRTEMQSNKTEPEQQIIVLSSDDEDNDMESDDDIMILDAEEAFRLGKFKKTSFEENSNRLAKYQKVDDNKVTPFNQPVPVSHFTNNDYDEVARLNLQRAQESLEENIKRKEDLLHKHEQLTSDYTSSLRRANELLQHLTLLQNHLRREESRENKDENTIMSLKNEISFKGAEYHNSRRGKESSASSLNGIASKLSWLTTTIRDAKSRIQNFVKTRGQINIIENPFNSSFINGDSSSVENQYLKSGFTGFSSNVYTDNDENDLQDLLDNIRPDEELEEEGLSLTPSELAITLLKHQRMGLAWLLRMEESISKGGILADDMGLGKTVQAIALMMSHQPTDPNCKTTLIIAPVSLLRQWAAEIESKIKPTTRVNIAIYHGAEKKSLRTFRSMKEYDVVLTSYGTLSSEWKKHYKSPLEEARLSRNQNVLPDLESGGTSYTSPFFSSDAIFYRIILDEAQNIKNKSAIASKALYCIKGTHRFCLSGTPIQNNVEELYPLLRFLRIKPYNEESKFRSDIVIPIRSKSSAYDDFDKKKSIQKLRALLRAILLRRSKNSLIDGKPILSLPEKHVIECKVSMEDEELEYYKNLEQGIQKKAKTLLANEKMGSTSSILTLLLRLRQACCHSFLVEIGRMNNEKLEDNKTLVKSDWKSMYANIQKFEQATISRIIEEVHQGNLLKAEDDINSHNSGSNEDLFTCPICFDVLGYESIVLFPGCGHMICNNCIVNYFERFEIGDGSEGKRIASCFLCSTSIRENELIDYNMFHMIHQEGYDIEKIAGFYNSKYSLGKTTNMQKIHQLIKDNDGFTPSAKMEACMKLIKDVIENYPGEKIIVFSQFLTLFDLMKLVLNKEKISFLRYDGSMSLDEKNSTIKQFYQGDSKVLLISLRAGNVGLTLTCASHVIIMDPFWNPYVEEQAMDRAHRIGQQREVHVHRILTSDSVEGRIMTLQNEKKELISGALDEHGMKSVSKLGRQELGFLFGLNALK